jgi:DNA repair photolyase
VAKFSVREMACKSVINRVTGMPFAWSINPYRGCRHACVYCYARPTHAFLGLNAAQDFEEIIFAKVNAPQVLRQELAQRSWKHESVAIGTATDPYQQAETRYKLTRGILEAFRDARNPLSITTKSPLVLRDLDLLTDLSRDTKVSVQITITTMDERLWRVLEPTTPKPWKRIEALRILRQRGIHAGIFLSPLLPGLTDDAAGMEAVIAAAVDAGAQFVWGGTLRLADGVRQVYFDCLRQEFPDLLPGYERLYRGAYAPAEYRERVNARLEALRQRYGLSEDRPQAMPSQQSAQPAPKQLSLFAAVA